MSIRDISEMSAVYYWSEFGDVEALVTALINLDGRSPTQELLEAIITALRGVKPQKRSRKIAVRNHDIWFSVRMLRKLDDVYPNLEDAFDEVARIYSTSESTVKTAYQDKERELKNRKKR